MIGGLFALSVAIGVAALASPATQEPVVTLVSSRLLGGSGVDDCDGVAVDRAGATYLGCHSDSRDLALGAAPARRIVGDLDAFVIKLSPDGRAEYVTQLGGSAWDAVMDVAADDHGRAWIVGTTYSDDLPLSPGALRPTYGGGEGDAFVARLEADGGIEWLTYVGGKGLDDGRRIMLDPSGYAYVTGRTASRDFPTTPGAFQTALADSTDAFVVKLDATGQAVYATYLGGSRQDIAWGLAVDGDGNAYVAGQTTSEDFPRVRPIQPALRGAGDAFFAIVDAAGAELLFSTYWGGSEWDQANAIALGSSGRVYLTGWTHSPDFPVTPQAVQRAYGGNHDAFVTGFDAMSRAVRFSTYLGGGADDSGAQLVAMRDGHVFAVGGTESADFPTARPHQPMLRGTKDGFVALLDPAGTSLVYSTYLGGGERELFEDAEAAPGNALILSGLTSSMDYPTAGPLTSKYAGGMYDIIVAVFRVQYP
ncbi:MAG: SBBP repeat-containing protein [Gemmatimonadetes bacterium]|nr:SBBP repeat-containing protein [Gemmatimonadota bacterium]